MDRHTEEVRAAMDGQRFDEWTQALGRQRSRRHGLQVLVAAALVGAATRASMLRVAADDGEQVGDFCDKHHPCKKPLVCVSHECEKPDTRKKGKKGKRHGGGRIHDSAR
jgi:hypothetical protein